MLAWQPLFDGLFFQNFFLMENSNFLEETFIDLELFSCFFFIIDFHYFLVKFGAFRRIWESYLIKKSKMADQR